VPPASAAAGADHDQVVGGPRLSEECVGRIAHRDELRHRDVVGNAADRPLEARRDERPAFVVEDGSFLEAPLLFDGELVCPTLRVEMADMGDVDALGRPPTVHDVQVRVPAACLHDCFAERCQTLWGTVDADDDATLTRASHDVDHLPGNASPGCPVGRGMEPARRAPKSWILHNHSRINFERDRGIPDTRERQLVDA
jgi:hypothetical protein